MPIKKFSPADSYTVGPGTVRQEMYKGSTLYWQGQRNYSTSYTVKRGEGSSIITESGSGGSFRPCEHTRESWVSLGEDEGSFQTGTPSNPSLTGGVTLCVTRGLTRYALGRAQSNLNSAWNSISTVKADGINWDEYNARAFMAMAPSLNSGNSLINFLYELKDFKHLAGSALNAFRSRQSVIYALINELGLNPRTLREAVRKGKTLKHLSKLYLSYEFAWRPFVSDVMQLISALTGFDKKWKEFVKRAGVPQQRYWGTFVTGTEEGGSVYYTEDVGPPGGTTGDYSPYVRVRVRKVADDGIRFHASMRYRYSLPSDALSAAGQIKGLLDSLGVRRNPAIVWNAIPYTFLLDWVVNVGKLLDSVSLDNLQVQTEIIEFCSSAKRKKVVSLTVQPNTQINGSYQWLGEREMRRLTKTHYRRTVGFPSRTSLLAVSGLSWSEISKMIALIMSRT